MASVTFQLNAAEMAALNRAVNGKGGFQTLTIALQGQLQPNGSIQVKDAQLGSILRCIGYTTGGFESRFRRAFGRSIQEIIA